MLGFSQYSTAQIDFTFEYNGPDTIFVGADCTAPLDWGAPASVMVSCNTPGCNIITFTLQSISGGYSELDPVEAGENVIITYFAEDDMGNNAFFGFDLEFVDNTPPVFDLGSVPSDASFDCLTDAPAPPALGSFMATDNCPSPGGSGAGVSIAYVGETNTPVSCAGGSISRTWSATDASGNVSLYTQTININADVTPPTITGFPTDLTEDCASADYAAWLAAQRAAFTATDGGCGIATISDDAPAAITSNCTAITVTFTATDNCSLTSTTQATYTVDDSSGPTITPPASTNVTLQCVGPVDVFTLIETWSDSLTVMDNCNSITWNNNFDPLTTPLVGGCGGTTGSVSVIYSAADDCGNTSALTINFTAVDTNDPNIDVGAIDKFVECDGSGNQADLTDWLNTRAGAVANDICTDNMDLVYSYIMGGMEVTPAQIQDALDLSLTTGCGGSITVRFGFTDACGNTSTSDADFTVEDTMDPVWDDFPNNIVLECDGTNDPDGAIQTWLDNDGISAASDGCQDVTITNNYTPIVFSCGFTGSTVVTFTATDNCGNAITATATATIEDTNTPNWDTDPMGMTVECDGTGNLAQYNAWLANFGGGVGSDNCGGTTITTDNPGFSDLCGATGKTNVTFTLTDECGPNGGNIKLRTASFTIVDAAPPVWGTAPSDLTVECDGSTDPGSAITDWLASFGTTGVVSDVCGNVSVENNYGNIPDPCVLGGVVVTWTATDDCGNTSIATATLTITDLTAPDWDTDPSDLNLVCDGTNDPGGAIAAWIANDGGGAASDLCNGAVIITHDYTGLSDLCGNTGVAIVTFTATDECSNASSRTAEVNVTDAAAPMITAAMDQMVECDNPAGLLYGDWLANNGGATATDACSDDADIVWTTNLLPVVPGCGSTFAQTVEFIATDDCGNSDMTTATYTLIDNISPKINPTATGGTEACGGADDQTALINYINSFGNAVATDNCGAVTWTNFDYKTSAGVIDSLITFNAAGTGYPVVAANDCEWMIELTFRVADECNNTSTTMASFEITDGEVPVLDAAPADVTVECDAIPAPMMLSATDNCDNNVLVEMDPVESNSTCPNRYTLTRTWTATDDCGNSTSTAQVITVTDNTPPTFSGVLGAITVECDNVPFAANVTAMDNCGGGAVTMVRDSTIVLGTCANEYVLTRIWTATDVCNNSATTSRVITVVDTTLPTFNGPADITVDCGQGTMPMVTGSPTNVDDNCGGDPTVMMSDAIAGGVCPNSFVITRTWTVTDICGNTAATYDQIITVTDLTAPMFTTPAANTSMSCIDDDTSDDAFSDWVATMGGAVAADNCSDAATLRWFAWEPGSYVITGNVVTTTGTDVGALTPVSCPSATPGIYRSETVDFVVLDECDNASVTTATFEITDITPPVISNCPADVTLPNIPGLCEANYTLPVPVIEEACANNSVPVINVVVAPITSANPGDESTIVDPVVLNFSPLPNSPTIAIDPITLEIELDDVDGEEPTEYFEIIGEDGMSLGQTANTPGQCGAVTTTLSIPAADFNAWVADGSVVITLMPNIPTGLDPIFAINDICPAGAGTGGGSSVTATLDYNSDSPTGLTYEYSINGGSRVTVFPVASVGETFDVGNNIVTYYATDCAGNESTCTFAVNVEDVEKPIISCPSDIFRALAADDDCDDGVELTLPLAPSILDNCGFMNTTQTQPFDTNDALLTFSYNPNYLEYIADDKDFTFVGLAANATGANVSFTVRITGDANDLEEYFTIIGEDGMALGTTEVGQANVSILAFEDCAAMPPVIGMVEAVFNVPVSTYNMWAADGSVDIQAVSNTTFAAFPPGGASDGINPSCVTFPSNNSQDGETDNVSSLSITLDYSVGTPFYYAEGATEIDPTSMMQPAIAPTHTFELGVTDVYYVINDLSGNADTCSFTVTVADNTPPEAKCEPTTVFVNPSGVQPLELNPAWLNADSEDNCGIESITISPTEVNCSQGGSNVPIVLTVTDESGNVSLCNSFVRVESSEATTNFSLGLCDNDTLYLFGRPPSTGNAGIAYTYLWDGPDNFISVEEDPIIPNVGPENSGTYTVTITGLTGCTTLGIAVVDVPATPNVPTIAASSDQICDNEDLTLTTQSYAGTNVAYTWYSGIPPTGTVVGTTMFPILNLSAPLMTNTYYVIAEVDGCVSDASLFTSVTVSGAPIADVNDPVITICGGESISLGSPTSGAGYSYQWTGPNGFNSTAQNPAAIVNASSADAGIYNLVVTANGCPSDAVTTTVVIDQTPTTPIISISDGLACEGETVTLTTNVTGAAIYTWVSPDFSQQNTTTNSLVLTNVSDANEGNYSVFISDGGCDSGMSGTVTLNVESPAAVIAINNGPTCLGGTVGLSVNTVPGATYTWSGPNGYASLSQNPTAPAVAGTYSVTVTTGAGCVSMATTDVEVTGAPAITALSNTGSGCVTGSDDIFLMATVFPVDDGSYTYSWVGPNGFTSVDEMPTLPNGTQVDNGSYTLMVTNAAGCTSQAMTTVVNVSNAPVTPTINGDAGLCEGDGLTLVTTGYVGTNVVYTWTTPLGTQTTQIPSLTIPVVTSANTGAYSVSVMVDGCSSNASAISNISVTPIPSAPIVSNNSPVCEGATIELSTPLIPGAQYEWTGPGNFNATIHNPVVFNASEDNEGVYTVRVVVNGCASNFSVGSNIEVNTAPTPPTIFSEGAVCITEAGSSATVTIIPETATPGATYTWYNAATNENLFGPSSSLNFTLTDFSGFTDGTFDFYVIAELNSCASVTSVPTSVTMNTIPNVDAFAGDDIPVCGGQSITLNAVAAILGTGEWTQTGGPSITIGNPSDPNTIISGLSSNETYTFLWTLSNGACGAYSSDEVQVVVDGTVDMANAGANIVECNEDVATLNAIAAGAGITGTWTQESSQALIGVVIDNPSDPNTTVSGLNPGNDYAFTWTLSNSGCGDFSSDEVQVSIGESNEVANAGDDISGCGDGSLTLNASVPENGIGTWSTTSAGLTIVQPNNPSTIVQGITAGSYTFTWTLDNGVCGSSTDEVSVNYEGSPMANPDMVTVGFNETVTFDVDDNDVTFGPYGLNVLTDPEHGRLMDDGEGSFTFIPDATYAGADQFTYEICSDFCPDMCSETSVTLSIGDDAPCDIPTIFTPNNDNVNDMFVIPCLATGNFSNNIVSIFNQWGDEVYRSTNYQNDWMGTYNGEDLPVGTYYYVVDFSNGQQPQDGFLVLER